VGDADGRASYRSVFAVGEFRSLFFAQIVSVLGNVIAQVALAVLVYTRTGSALLSALTFTLGLLPYLVGGTLLSGIVDRLPARRTLVSCDLVSAVVVGLMVLPVPIPVLLVLIFLAGLVDPVFAGVRAAILPDVLGTGPQFVLGRALFSMVWQGSQVAGYAAGGLLLAAVGPRGALALDSVSFLGSALLVRLGTRRREAIAPSNDNLLRDSLRSVRAVMSHPRMRQLMLLHWLVPTCALAPEALIAPYVHLLHRPTRDVGILLSAIAAGMLVSNLIIGRTLTTSRQRRLMVPAAMLMLVPLLAFGAPLGLVLSLLALAVSGLGSCFNLGRDSAFIAAAPESLRARALAIDQSGLMVVQGLGFAFWGLLAEFVAVRTTIVIAGATGLVLILALFWRPRAYQGEKV
jgi:predicted MFS family arabinose efflux permease